jgi:DNA-directed RNA polymerase subunit beta
MPYLADGRAVDVLLSPLGVPSRMNIGQILEIHLGLAAAKLGVKVATPIFDGATDNDIFDLMGQANLDQSGKQALYDGRTGELISPSISVGVMYMIKLNHMVDEKMHARNVGNYSLITQQPMGGKAQNGGQRFGEMEVWALYAYGVSRVLSEMMTVKSDDIKGRNSTWKAIKNGTPLQKGSVPHAFKVFVKELQALCMHVELIEGLSTENEVLKSDADLQRESFK